MQNKNGRTPRDEPGYRALMELIRTSELLRKEGDRFFAAFGLTLSQFNVLMILRHERPAGCSQSELSRLLLVNRANTSESVRRMLQRGWIERRDDPRDERSWVVRLTPDGKRLLEEVEPPYYGRAKRIMSANPGKENGRLVEDLMRIQTTLGGLSLRTPA